jgi:hypothetical protein
MIKGYARVPLTNKWDHHFIVTHVRGKVVTVTHVPTGRTSKWNRNKVKLVDPYLSWEGIGDRPRAQRPSVQNNAVPLQVPAPVEIPAEPLPQIPPQPVPVEVKVGAPEEVKQAYPDTNDRKPLVTRFARRHYRQPYPSQRPPRVTHTWEVVAPSTSSCPEKMEVLAFCQHFFSSL